MKIDIDFTGSEGDVKEIRKLYKVTLEETGPTMADAVGTPENLRTFLLGKEMAWNEDDIREVYPELYKKPEVELSGQDGNAFAVMGSVIQALKNFGASDETIKNYQEEAIAGDYDNLLRVTWKYVEIR